MHINICSQGSKEFYSCTVKLKIPGNYESSRLSRQADRGKGSKKAAVLWRKKISWQLTQKTEHSLLALTSKTGSCTSSFNGSYKLLYKYSAGQTLPRSEKKWGFLMLGLHHWQLCNVFFSAFTVMHPISLRVPKHSTVHLETVHQQSLLLNNKKYIDLAFSY